MYTHSFLNILVLSVMVFHLTWSQKRLQNKIPKIKLFWWSYVQFYRHTLVCWWIELQGMRLLTENYRKRDRKLKLFFYIHFSTSYVPISRKSGLKRVTVRKNGTFAGSEMRIRLFRTEFVPLRQAQDEEELTLSFFHLIMLVKLSENTIFRPDSYKIGI